jgi:hypothetical protein
LIASNPAVGIDYQTFLNEIKHHSLLKADRLITFLEHNLLQIEIIDAFDLFQATIWTFYDFKLAVVGVNMKELSILCTIFYHMIRHRPAESNVEF